MIPAFLRPRRPGAGRGFLRSAGALGLAAAAAWLLPLSGCFGGTTSEGGNPGITLQFTRDGKPAKFTGLIQIIAKDSNPAFFRPRPEDGSTSPRIIIGGASFLADLYVPNASSITLDWKDLARYMYVRPELTLAKSSAAGIASGKLPDFNFILISEDSLAGWLQGVHPDASGPYRLANGDSGYAFDVDLTREHRYSGQVDTTGPAGRPLGLFVPGTPYYAAIHGDRFSFEGLPAGRLPLRWLSANGRVHAVADSLGSRNDTGFEHKTPILSAGSLLDSLSLPPAVPTLEAPAASPAGQYAFTDSVSVSLVAQGGAAIYYTLDGSTPDLGSKAYKAPILLRSSATLKAVAYLKGWNKSPISVNNYVLVPQPPKALPTGGIFPDTLQVTLSVAAAGASIRFTVDGSEPTAASPLYTGVLTLRASTVVKAVAVVPGLGLSQSVSHQYVLVADSSLPAPVATPPSSSFQDSLRITLAAAATGSILRYTLDGTDPTANSGVIYSGPILLSANDTTLVKAVAVKDGKVSPVSLNLYVRVGPLNVPVAKPPSDEFKDSLKVSLVSADPQTVIYYTLDGSVPLVTSGALYSSPILLSATSVVKAIAVKGGLSSPVTVERYLLASDSLPLEPTASPEGVSFKDSLAVNLNALAGSKIYYTTDGSEPGPTSIQYAGPFWLRATTQIKTMAVRYGRQSPTKTYQYVLVAGSSQAPPSRPGN